MTTKERQLKKYEADPRPVASDGMQPAMDLFSPFGPMLARFRAPASLVARVNRYADGQVVQGRGIEFVLPPELVGEGGDDSLAQFTGRAIERYVAGMEGSALARVSFEVFWVISQYAGTPSPVHFHSSDISGVLYLKVPEIDASEEAKTYISGRHAGYINFMIGGKQRFSKSLISFRPQVGDFYLFPGWLLHGAEPFNGTGERRSMSFNAVVSTAE